MKNQIISGQNVAVGEFGKKAAKNVVGYVWRMRLHLPVTLAIVILLSACTKSSLKSDDLFQQKTKNLEIQGEEPDWDDVLNDISYDLADPAGNGGYLYFTSAGSTTGFTNTSNGKYYVTSITGVGTPSVTNNGSSRVVNASFSLPNLSSQANIQLKFTCSPSVSGSSNLSTGSVSSILNAPNTYWSQTSVTNVSFANNILNFTVNAAYTDLSSSPAYRYGDYTINFQYNESTNKLTITFSVVLFNEGGGSGNS